MSLQMESRGTEQHEIETGGGSTNGRVAAENQNNGAASGRVVSNEAPPAEVNGASQSDVAAKVNLGADNEHDWMSPPPSSLAHVVATAHVVAPTPTHATALPLPQLVRSKSKMGASSQPAPTINAQRPKRAMQSRYMKPFAVAPAAASQNNAATEMQKKGKGIASTTPKGKAPQIPGPKGKTSASPTKSKVSQIPHVFLETARTRKLVKIWSDVTDSFNEVKKRNNSK
ncbi:hypothetical protein RIF29_19261 [Crotalaria pallida]|uniref:Uncharacterized protein n=1 Tax=Crotalaria pallida TaxID=3830 RepID=A0AAN9EZ42_CROPI